MGQEDHMNQDQFNDHIASELRKGDMRMNGFADDLTQLRASMEQNNASTEEVKKNTAEMLDVFESWKGAMKVLEWFGSIAKPIGYIAAAVGAVVGLYTAYRAGRGS